MSYSVLISDLITEARYAAEMVNTNYVTDAEFVTYFDKAYRELYAKIVEANELYTISSQNYTLTSGQEAYNLPSDFFKLLGVDLLFNNDPANLITLMPFNFNQRNIYKNSLFSFNGFTGYAYYLRGNQIVFTPMPDSNQQVTIWYTPDPTSITATNQTLVLSPAITPDYLILSAAIRAKQKEESDASILIRERDILTDQIIRSVASRDAGLPKKVTEAQTLYAQNYYYPLFSR